MIKRLSPEYFKRVCETIWRHDFKTDFAYRSYFRKFMQIFEPDDVKEFNALITIFTDRWHFTPMDIEDRLNAMYKSNKIIRIRHYGKKLYLTRELILKDIEDLIRWCHKRLNEYYKLYGINIDGIDVGELNDIKEMN